MPLRLMTHPIVKMVPGSIWRFTLVDTASGPRPGEPAELASLLEMKGEKSAGNTAVSRMRPNAIREAAQLVTFQTAIAWRYGQLAEADGTP